MANLNETDDWAAGIYQIEEDDPVLGGPAGITNQPPTQLASRTRFQRVRNVTPWVAALAYPASLAFVSHAGTTWKSVAASTAVEPGTDETKWTRWAHTQAEIEALLSESAVRFDEAQVLPNPQKLQARTNIGAEAIGIAASEVQKGAARYGIDTGAANAAAVTYAPAITGLIDGMVLIFEAAATNTGATTLNVNGLGAQPVIGQAQAALQGGEIVAGGKCTVVWHDSLSSFVLLGCTGAALQVGPATKPGHAMQLGQATGRLLRTLVYVRIAGVQNVSIDGAAPTSVGASTWTRSASMLFAEVEVQGAGGAGAGATGAAGGNVSLGAPGGSGSCGGARLLAAAVGASQPVTVGARGAKVSGGAGGSGGTSSIGALITAPGGIGGGTLTNQVPPAVNGNGGTAPAPTGANLFSVRGVSNTASFASSNSTNAMLGGTGGASRFGGGAAGPAGNNAGIDAVNYGAGGSGIALNSGGGTAAGGDAGDGIVVIREYA